MSKKKVGEVGRECSKVDLISSGDRVADQKGRARFLKAYAEKNRLDQPKEGSTLLLVGTSEYPFTFPLVRQGEQGGYASGPEGDAAEPFHGYYFQILKAKGEHANGCVFNNVADGKMVLGFALLAYPAKYGVSGIMTFKENCDDA